MSALLDDLRAKLAPQYRIDRELGGGGMSRVFLAEETALSRQVVLKLPLPEFAAMLSPDRFQREVRLAAGLQHPHIVPLLTAGHIDDLVYYTMPFVEGESLRARLNRERELPVTDAIRLLRDVADALSYAHGHGIVHRDIKPDNILLSHRHAVVTDFGIAKAITDAAGGTGRLTGTGVAIGTPGYMSPEQATADSEIDQRTDLYALGVLGYEILAGEAPFRGPNAQALIGAQLTRAAAPLGEVRPTVPAGLAAIIHRCLEKRPADRFQSAEEVVAALDAVTTTISATGANLPTATRAPARAWPLPLVVAWFGVSGAAVLGLAWALRGLIGLPDWFVAAAILLLVLGLPVVMAAAAAHNRRLTGPARPGGALEARLTIRGALWGGVVAFGGLALVSTAYMAMRSLGIGPIGTLVASGKLKEQGRLIVADFANETRDPLLGPALTQAFRIDFSQSKLISLVEADYVRQILRRMERPDSTPLTLAVSREIAQRGGYPAVVAGTVQQVGPSLLVSAQLVSADSGIVLASVRETARDSTQILDAVDRVSKRLRERIGESLRSIRSNAPLAEVTTGSLEALRKYSEALEAEGMGDNERGINRLEEAVAIDTGFAMAWRKLGTMLTNDRERAGKATDALTRAFGQRDRLTFREKRLTENSYYLDVVGDLDSAMAAMQSLLAEYPDDAWALNNLGVVYEMAGERARAEEPYTRALRNEPEDFLVWGNLFSALLGLGRFDSAAALLASIRQRFPPGPEVGMEAILLFLTQLDFAGGEQEVRLQLDRYRTDPRAQVRLYRILAGVLTIRGKLAEASRALETSATLLAARGLAGRALEQRARRVVAMAMYRGDTRAAMAELDQRLRDTPLSGLAERDRPLRWLLNIAIRIGDRRRAEELLREFERNPGDVPGRGRRAALHFARGEVLAMEKATLPQAIAELHQARRGPAQVMLDVTLADAFDRAGMPDSALAYYQRWAAVGEGGWDAGMYNIWPPIAFFRMAELYEAKGDRTKAADSYGRFTELWREADPELQPRVREAKRRLAGLLAEPRP